MVDVQFASLQRKKKVLHVTVPVFRVKYFKAKTYRSHLISQKSTIDNNVFNSIILNFDDMR